MRRRRQKNPLLMRIIGISVLVHILALPVLARFGAFKKIQEHFVEARMVVLPAPPAETRKPPEVKKTAKADHKPAPSRKSTASTPHNSAAKSNLPQPKVIADAGGSSGGGDGSPTVEANGSGKAGVVPAPTGGGTPKKVEEKTPEAPKVVEAPKKAVEQPGTLKPELPKVEKPTPKPEPAPRKAPVLTEAEAISSPAPTIPDDLRSEALDKTCIAEVTVSAEGKPTSINMVQSSGVGELDRIALDTAKKWKFKPATRDGEAIESRVRLHIEFQVDG